MPGQKLDSLIEEVKKALPKDAQSKFDALDPDSKKLFSVYAVETLQKQRDPSEVYSDLVNRGVISPSGALLKRGESLTESLVEINPDISHLAKEEDAGFFSGFVDGLKERGLSGILLGIPLTIGAGVVSIVPYVGPVAVLGLATYGIYNIAKDAYKNIGVAAKGDEDPYIRGKAVGEITADGLLLYGGSLLSKVRPFKKSFSDIADTASSISNKIKGYLSSRMRDSDPEMASAIEKAPSTPAKEIAKAADAAKAAEGAAAVQEKPPVTPEPPTKGRGKKGAKAEGEKPAEAQPAEPPTEKPAAPVSTPPPPTAKRPGEIAAEAGTKPISITEIAGKPVSKDKLVEAIVSVLKGFEPPKDIVKTTTTAEPASVAKPPAKPKGKAPGKAKAGEQPVAKPSPATPPAEASTVAAPPLPPPVKLPEISPLSVTPTEAAPPAVTAPVKALPTVTPPVEATPIATPPVEATPTVAAPVKAPPAVKRGKTPKSKATDVEEPTKLAAGIETAQPPAEAAIALPKPPAAPKGKAKRKAAAPAAEPTVGVAAEAAPPPVETAAPVSTPPPPVASPGKRGRSPKAKAEGKPTVVAELPFKVEAVTAHPAEKPAVIEKPPAMTHAKLSGRRLKATKPKEEPPETQPEGGVALAKPEVETTPPPPAELAGPESSALRKAQLQSLYLQSLLASILSRMRTPRMRMAVGSPPIGATRIRTSPPPARTGRIKAAGPPGEETWEDLVWAEPTTRAAESTYGYHVETVRSAPEVPTSQQLITNILRNSIYGEEIPIPAEIAKKTGLNSITIGETYKVKGVNQDLKVVGANNTHVVLSGLVDAEGNPQTILVRLEEFAPHVTGKGLEPLPPWAHYTPPLYYWMRRPAPPAEASTVKEAQKALVEYRWFFSPKGATTSIKATSPDSPIYTPISEVHTVPLPDIPKTIAVIPTQHGDLNIPLTYLYRLSALEGTGINGVVAGLQRRVNLLGKIPKEGSHIEFLTAAGKQAGTVKGVLPDMTVLVEVAPKHTIYVDPEMIISPIGPTQTVSRTVGVREPTIRSPLPSLPKKQLPPPAETTRESVPMYSPRRETVATPSPEAGEWSESRSILFWNPRLAPEIWTRERVVQAGVPEAPSTVTVRSLVEKHLPIQSGEPIGKVATGEIVLKSGNEHYIVPRESLVHYVKNEPTSKAFMLVKAKGEWVDNLIRDLPQLSDDQIKALNPIRIPVQPKAPQLSGRRATQPPPVKGEAPYTVHRRAEFLIPGFNTVWRISEETVDSIFASGSPTKAAESIIIPARLQMLGIRTLQDIQATPWLPAQYKSIITKMVERAASKPDQMRAVINAMRANRMANLNIRRGSIPISPFEVAADLAYIPGLSKEAAERVAWNNLALPFNKIKPGTKLWLPTENVYATVMQVMPRVWSRFSPPRMTLVLKPDTPTPRSRAFGGLIEMDETDVLPALSVPIRSITIEAARRAGMGDIQLRRYLPSKKYIAGDVPDYALLDAIPRFYNNRDLTQLARSGKMPEILTRQDKPAFEYLKQQLIPKVQEEADLARLVKQATARTEEAAAKPMPTPPPPVERPKPQLAAPAAEPTAQAAAPAAQVQAQAKPTDATGVTGLSQVKLNEIRKIISSMKLERVGAIEDYDSFRIPGTSAVVYVAREAKQKVPWYAVLPGGKTVYPLKNPVLELKKMLIRIKATAV